MITKDQELSKESEIIHAEVEKAILNAFAVVKEQCLNNELTLINLAVFFTVFENFIGNYFNDDKIQRKFLDDIKKMVKSKLQAIEGANF